MNTRARNLTDDWIRIICAMLIISKHTLITIPYRVPNGFLYVLQTCVSVTMFFFLSGKYNLDDPLLQNNDFKGFYKKRLATLILPYALFLIVCCLVECLKANGKSIAKIITGVVLTHLQHPYYHLWFMDSLIMLTIATPFLTIMLRNLSDRWLFLLILTGITFQFIDVMMTHYWLSSPFGDWPFMYVVIAYIAGYYAGKHQSKHTNIWFASGIGTLIVLALSSTSDSWFVGSRGQSALSVIVVMGIYARINSKPKLYTGHNIIYMLAKASFGAYLLHPLVYTYIASQIVYRSKAESLYMSFVLTAVLSFGIAIVLAVIYKPIKQLLLQTVRNEA